MMYGKQQITYKTLTQLIKKLGSLLSTCDLVIDSRLVKKDTIFCAYPGNNFDGRDFIASAVKNGARAIVVDNADDYSIKEDVGQVLVIAVANLQQYVGILAAYKNSFPSLATSVVGVTGTNGKTSISYWLSELYTKIGQKSALIGTLGAGIYPDIISHNITTPDPLSLENDLQEFAKAKVDIVAMEVSSHALDQGRVNGIFYNTVIFTNLTQDHLDYHHNMENYYEAKSQLFYWLGLKNIIINIDDSYGLRLFNEVKNHLSRPMDDGSRHLSLASDELAWSEEFSKKCDHFWENIKTQKVRLVSYGINHGEIYAKNVQMTLKGMVFELYYENQFVTINVPIIGEFNVYNLLAVSAVMILDGHSLLKVAEVLPNITSVRGRMEAIIKPNKPLVIVDFAHTPDSLQKALETLAKIEHSGKLYCIFGCGGNRDAIKRPIMGKIATKLADQVVITSDNPRFEKAGAIIKDICNGLTMNNYEIIEDRREAIRSVIAKANCNDIVLIAGKGHEAYQEINGVKYDFLDKEVATAALTT